MQEELVRYARLGRQDILELLGSWHVAVLNALDLDGIKAWDLRLPPGFRAPPHEHDLPFFCILLDGWLENTYTHRSVSFHPSLNVFHPAGTVHTGRAGPRGAHVLTLELTPSWERRLEPFPPLPREPTIVPFEDGAWLARRLLRELRAPEACSPLVLEGMALELAAAVSRSRADGRTPAFVPRALEVLHERFAEPLTLGAVAAELDVTPARLSTEFRRYTKRTFGDYLRDLRVAFVKERLRDADVPLTDLAAAAGFADQAHCTRVFRSVTGWTPGRMRSALRAGRETADVRVPGALRAMGSDSSRR